MKTIKKTLFITPSHLKKNEIIQEYENYPFLTVKTLSQIINEIFEFFDDKNMEIDSFIGSKIIYKCIQNIEYFSYLTPNSKSLEIIFDFFIKLSTNEVLINEFDYNEEKKTALKQAYECYTKYKKENNLFDENDKLDLALNVIDKYLSKFDEIYIGSFQINDINLLKNKKEVKLLQKIKGKTLPQNNKMTPTNLYQNFVFNSYDEVRTAIKIAKKLIKNGESPDKIVIVTSNFSVYAPYFYILLNEYQMQGYDNTGFPLFTISNNEKYLENHYNVAIQKAYARYLENLMKIKNQLKILKIDFNEKDLKEFLLKNTKYKSSKQGILFLEHNRLLGLNKGFKHIIFIGTDITNFPPKQQSNFLYDEKISKKFFMQNDVYESSVTFYNELKRLSENLYIITATYNNKRKLAPSIIIDKHINKTFDVSDIQSRTDILKNQKRIEEKSLKDFQESLINLNFTKYDGNIEGEFKESKKLSASALNTYIKCPMQYYFNYILKLNAPQNEKQGFDAKDRGSLMHKCFEIFTKRAKNDNFLNKSKEELYQIMLECSNEAYNTDEIKELIKQENVYHKLELKLLQKGLDNTESKAELAKFVDYFYENKFDGFKHSNPEEKFILDENFKFIDLDNMNEKEIEEKRFIKGFIDRLDELEDNSINIIDYKSSLKNKKKKNFNKDTLKDFQLGLYLLYAIQKYPNKSNYKASLVSFKESDNKKSIFLSTNGKGKGKFDEEYIEILKDKIKEISKNIADGNFMFSNEECNLCDYKYICHADVLKEKNGKK